MPRLEAPIGRDGPIVEVSIWIGPGDANAFTASRKPIPPPVSLLGLVDTGAELTAIDHSILAMMDLVSRTEFKVGSSSLGTEVRQSPVYEVRMTLGPIRSIEPPRWRTIYALGLDVISRGVTVLIGRDLLATCRFTYDGRKHRLMMSY